MKGLLKGLEARLFTFHIEDIAVTTGKTDHADKI